MSQKISPQEKPVFLPKQRSQARTATIKKVWLVSHDRIG